MIITWVCCVFFCLLSYWYYSSCLSWIRCFPWWFSKLNKQWRLNKEICNEANPLRIQKIVSFFLSLINTDWTHKPDFQFMLQQKVVSVFKWANVFLLPSVTCNLHIQLFKSSFFYLGHWIITESKVTIDLWRCLCCPSSFCNDGSIFPVIWLISSWVFDLFWSDTFYWPRFRAVSMFSMASHGDILCEKRTSFLIPETLS